MITYQQAMQQIRGKACPRCLHTELSAELHLEDGSECVCTARCEHCGFQFVIEYSRFEDLDELQKRAEQELRSSPCKVCEHTDYDLLLQCQQPNEDCYLEATCRTCRTAYLLDIQDSRIRLIRKSANEV